MKELIYTIIYSGLKVLAILLINMNYSKVVQYYLFNKLLNVSNLYAIQYFEIFLTNLSLSIYITIIICIPLVIGDIIRYIKKGLYKKEYKEIRKKYKEKLRNGIIENIINVMIVIPIIINSTEVKEIKQLYTYGNITNLIIKINIIWNIMGLIINNLKERKQIYIIIISLIISIIPNKKIIEIIEIIIGLCMYIEIKIIINKYKGRYHRPPPCVGAVPKLGTY